MQLPFSLIVPGQPPITNFQVADQIYHIDMNNPINIPHVCFTLTQPLENNLIAAAFYYCLPPYNQFNYLGYVNNDKPSGIFQTGFNLKSEMINHSTVKFCIRAQSLAEIQNQQTKDGKKQYAKLVAQNLYNYMMSHNKSGMLVNGVQGEYIVAPSNFLDKWLLKFQAKYKMDPNFILKTTQM